ncbi:hypothetical protein AB5J55_41355 [Streptomyces sp. R11]|uniref:Transposase n=1 Tax=Streptomyces sp. R11 TaxID=3238625 RepID=A0AB39NHF3_9ACTN
MRLRVRTGVPRGDVPVEYGPWGRICDLFRRWQRDGAWHRGLTRLQDRPTQEAQSSGHDVRTSSPSATRRRCWSQP